MKELVKSLAKRSSSSVSTPSTGGISRCEIERPLLSRYLVRHRTPVSNFSIYLFLRLLTPFVNIFLGENAGLRPNPFDGIAVKETPSVFDPFDMGRIGIDLYS